MKRIIFSGLPLILFASWMYYVNRSNELMNVGKYSLTEYPNCNPCILELKTNNLYEVKDDEKVVEVGKWRYDSGGDFWIVELVEHGQLGSGKLTYSDKVE